MLRRSSRTRIIPAFQKVDWPMAIMMVFANDGPLMVHIGYSNYRHISYSYLCVILNLHFSFFALFHFQLVVMPFRYG